MNRKLRVDYSNDGGGGDDDSVSTLSLAIFLISLTYLQSAQMNNMSYLPNILPQNGMAMHHPPPPPQNGSSLPPLPQGTDLAPGLTCPDAISRTLNTLPQRQLLDVLSQMKILASTAPEKATELLHQAPQLSYAIFQALLLMGLVSIEAMKDVVDASSGPQPIPAPLQGYAAPGTYPPGFPPPPPHMSGQLGVQMGTPPPAQYGYPPPPPPQRAPPPQQAPQAQAAPDLDELMQQVLAMPQHIIDQLPASERDQIMALKASVGR